MLHESVRLTDLASHGTRATSTSWGAGRGIIIGKLSKGEIPKEPWEMVFKGMRHTVGERQYGEFEKAVKRVGTLSGLELLVRTHLQLANPMPEPSESTFKTWMRLWACEIVRERKESIEELNAQLDEMTNSIHDDHLRTTEPPDPGGLR
jgi:hypothetical protein